MDKKTQIQIQEINRLMNYDRSKTLLEQGEFKPAYGPTWGQATHGKPSDFVKAAEDRAEFIHKYRHEIADVLAIGTMFIPVIGPVLSLGIDLANAAMYYEEGDTEMAGLVAAFSIIPFGELVRMVPGVKKAGIELITRAVQKSKAGKALSKVEQETIESIVENSAKISRRAKREFLKKVLNEGFKKLSLKEKVAVLYKIVKSYRTMGGQGFGLMNQGVIQIGGIFITYSKLISIFGLDGSEPDLELQKELEKHADEIGDKMIEDIDETFGTTIEERDDEFINLLQTAIESVGNSEVETTVNADTSGDTIQNGPRFGNLKVIQSEPIEFEDLLSGKHVIQPGAKGDVVRHIQRILVKLGYDLGTTGKNKDGIDGDYTKNGKMESAVMKFQRDNGLDSDGDVGINTAKKLKELYDKKE